jgi:hypothetical protein
MLDMLNNCGMDSTNFSNTLILWVATNNTPSDIIFGAINLTLTASGNSAKNTLNSTYGWDVQLITTYGVDKTLQNNYTLTGEIVCKDPVYIISPNNDYISGLSIMAGLALRNVAVTSDAYSAIDKDVVICVNYSGIATITLPPAAILAKESLNNIPSGKYFIITDVSGALNGTTIKINIVPQGSDTIVGTQSKELLTAYESISLYSYGSNWLIIN